MSKKDAVKWLKSYKKRCIYEFMYRRLVKILGESVTDSIMKRKKIGIVTEIDY